MDYIIGYENLYKINRQGEVWSCIYRKFMKPSMQEGYVCLNLKREDGRHKARIHRLLALQYIPNPDNLPEVDHIDRNRSNNTLSNLRWTSHRQNMNNIEEGNGWVQFDKNTSERLGYDYYKASYSITVDGIRQQFHASHKDKSLLEKWVETKGQVEIPRISQKGTQRKAEGSIKPREDIGGWKASFRNKSKSSKDKSVCEKWLEEQKSQHKI